MPTAVSLVVPASDRPGDLGREVDSLRIRSQRLWKAGPCLVNSTRLVERMGELLPCVQKLELLAQDEIGLNTDAE